MCNTQALDFTGTHFSRLTDPLCDKNGAARNGAGVLIMLSNGGYPDSTIACPGPETHSEVVQGTAAFPHQIADTFLPCKAQILRPVLRCFQVSLRLINVASQTRQRTVARNDPRALRGAEAVRNAHAVSPIGLPSAAPLYPCMRSPPPTRPIGPLSRHQSRA